MLKPKVLVIENAIALTGSVKSALRSCSSLSAEFDFLFILPKHSLAKSFIKREGFAVEEMPLLEISKSWKVLFYVPVLFFNTFLLRNIIKRSGAKLIVANDFYNMLPVLYKLFGGRIPYVTYVRFIPSRFPKLLVDTWCFFHIKLAEKIIAVSLRVHRDLKPSSKVILVYNELPVENGYAFSPYDQDSRLILYLSNYIRGKGLEYAIRTFASLGDEFSEWTLRFVGGDMGLKKNKAYKKDLVTLAENTNVSGRIEWGDFTENVADEYKRAALVLNFSDSESFSLTCIEAMAIGRPVIATMCGGPEEIITQNVDGELVEVRNEKQMAFALKKLLSNANLRKVYGERAHASVSTKFSLENTAYKLRPIYHNAISGQDGVPF